MVDDLMRVLHDSLTLGCDLTSGMVLVSLTWSDTTDVRLVDLMCRLGSMGELILRYINGLIHGET